MEIYKRPGLLSVENDSIERPESEYMNAPAFSVNLVAHPELVELFDKHAFTRRGRFTWSLSDTPAHRNNFKDFYKEYSQKFTPYTLHAGESSTNVAVMQHRQNVDLSANLAQPLAFTHALIRNIRDARLISRHVANFFGANIVMNIDGDYLGETLINDRYKRAFLENPYDATELYTATRGAILVQKNSFANNNILRDNFSPFVLTMTSKRDVLYVRLKLGSFLDFSEHYDRHGTFARNREMFLLNTLSGIEYDVTTPSKKMLNITDFQKTIHDVKSLFNENIFTPESLPFIQQIEEKAQSTLFVNAMPGKPGTVKVMNAFNKQRSLMVKKFNKNGDMSRLPDKKENISAFSSVEMKLSSALALEESNKNVSILIHPSLVDMQKMSNAQPFKGESRLYGYQRKAVGLQLSTNRGMLNSLDTGIGKSIVQLTAMREHARTIENYRGVIVCQSNTTKQWKEYMLDDKWFPEAHVVIIDSGKSVKKLIEALSVEGPVVVIVTFNMVAGISDILDETAEIQETLLDLSDSEKMEFLMNKQDEAMKREPKIADILINAHWNDISADEAMSIRNSTSSKQAKALWHMRNNSDCATALTATPFNKSIDDIANLLEWVRNDKHLFYGNKLSKNFDQENITEENARDLFESLFPMVFRFTKEEAQAEEKDNIKIPEELAPETLLLKPTPSELALSNACEYELKRIINELETALDNYESKTDDEKAEVDAARESLKEAHGHWMAGTNVARMATSNPASILKSNSIAAQLLVGQGLVENAMQDTPTKQRVLLERLPKHIEKGQQVLVFTDFVDVAEDLAIEMEKIGIRAGVFGGKNRKNRDENRIAFQKGELDVLVCTKAAERGLTLHRASVTYHYDMSWTLEPLLQKAGRAARVGSDNETVETYILILEGTIEEKVVDKVFTQGTMSSMVLDKARGVDIKNTTTGRLMGSLMNTSSNLNSRRGAVEFGKALLGV